MAKDDDIGYGKLAAAGGAGTLATAAITILDYLGYKLPPEMIAAVQTVITAGVVWFVPHTLLSGRKAHGHAAGHAHHH